MKILYAASQPDRTTSLTLKEEITELQRRFAARQTEPVEAIFLPDLDIETLPEEISKHEPDIIHISAHGDGQALALASGDAMVPLSGERLRIFLNRLKPPRLVYVNACNSAEVARELVKVAKMAIGTTAPISNRAARAAAVQFYDRLLQGRDVQEAFEVNRAVVQAIHGGCSSELFAQPNVDPATEVLQPVPTLVACVEDRKPNGGEWDVEFRLGVAGCPGATTQVVFFTDDESFIEKGVQDLTWVARTSPVRHMLWLDRAVRVYGDCRLFACGVTADGRCFSIGATLVEALESWALRAGYTDAQRQALGADVQLLRANDGSELPVKRDATGKKKKK